jgi:hypothetical protein
VRVIDGVECQGAWLNEAIAGTGLVEFDVDYDPFIKVFPCEVSVDATFELDTDLPEMLTFTASALPVDRGC